MSDKNKSIKKLYSFELTDTKDNTVHKFFVRKPGASLSREGELFHYRMLNSAIKEHGLLPTVLISKRFANDDGILSKEESLQYDKFYARLAEITKELLLLEEEKKNEGISGFSGISGCLEPKPFDKEKLIKEREDLRRTLQQFEANKTSLFNISAESFARNKTILFWILFLSYKEDDKGNFIPLYGDGTFEERLAKSDEIEDGDDVFLQAVVKKFLFHVSYWFYSGSTKPEEFEKAERDLNS